LNAKPITSIFVIFALVGIITLAPSAFADTRVTIGKGADGLANAGCVVTNDCFTPNPVQVSPGGTVTWTNTDTGAGHTVTSGKPDNSTGNYVGAVFDSSLLASGKKFSHTFTAADVGTINYFCLVHPWMIGEITVGISPQRTPSHSNGVYASPTISSSTQRPILNATPHELTSINEARNNQAIAAEVNVVNQTVQTTSLNSNVSVQTNNMSPESLSISVSSSSHTGPNLLLINLAATTINVAKLKDLGAMYDGEPIPPASDIDAILHAKSSDSPSFAAVVTQRGAQILILVPHFSTHTITITYISKMIPAGPEFPFALLTLVVGISSLVLVSRIKRCFDLQIWSQVKSQ